MWALVNTDNGSIIDIAADKYTSIYEDLSIITWKEWPDAEADFNKENIAIWCYDSSKTNPFIKKTTVITTNINDSIEMNKITAKILLAKTDWAILSDITLYNREEFIKYRSTIRDCIINPREGCIKWPDLIEPEWFDKPMIINVYISSLFEYSTVTLPFNSISSLNVNWGNGFSTSYTTPPTYTYNQVSSYTISISGRALSYGDTNIEYAPIQLAISSVSQWGNIGLTSLAGAFSRASNLVSLPNNIPSSVTDMSLMFQNIMNPNVSKFNQDISGWDVSNVTNMDRMFMNAISFNQPLNNWNTSSVTNMRGMFAFTEFNQDISKWNVSNVTNMDHMFYNTTSFNQPLNTWNTSSVTDMTSMFEGASSFNQDLSLWNVSNVTAANNIFCNCPLSTITNESKRPFINIQGGYTFSCG